METDTKRGEMNRFGGRLRVDCYVVRVVILVRVNGGALATMMTPEWDANLCALSCRKREECGIVYGESSFGDEVFKVDNVEEPAPYPANVAIAEDSGAGRSADVLDSRLIQLLNRRRRDRKRSDVV